MTIPTKLNLPAKEASADASLPQNADFKNSDKAKAAYEAEFYDDPNQDAVNMDRYLAWKRHRILTFMCMTFLVFWLLMASILGTLVFYRYIARRPMFIGTCVTQVSDDDDSSPFSLAQTVEIGPDNQVEKLTVPGFGRNSPGSFIHDFLANITLIMDVKGQKCYVKPLDRSVVVPPMNMIDLIEKITNGYYEVRPEMVKNKYRLQEPPLSAEQLEKLNSVTISQQCHDVPTYWLVPILTESRRARRSLLAECKETSFAYLANAEKVVSETVKLC